MDVTAGFNSSEYDATDARTGMEMDAKTALFVTENDVPTRPRLGNEIDCNVVLLRTLMDPDTVDNDDRVRVLLLLEVASNKSPGLDEPQIRCKELSVSGANVKSDGTIKVV